MMAAVIRKASVPVALLGLAWLGAGLARCAEAENVTHSVGIWVLKLDNGSRECRVTLRAQSGPSGYAIGMPVGCHRAFPALTDATAWNDGADGKIQFETGGGQPLLVFEPTSEGALQATSPEGEILRLEPVGAHRATKLRSASGVSGDAATKGAKPAVAAASAPKRPVPTVAEMAGHYAVLRQGTKDTGCMVTLDESAHGPKGSFKANLAPACRDQGIVIFDPVGWQLQGGRLVLTARKGHTTKLDPQEDGSWMKDAKEGKSLSLKKM